MIWTDAAGFSAVPGQQRSQSHGGPSVADVGAGAQPVQVAALGQQVGQPPGSIIAAGVGAGAQPVQVAAGEADASEELGHGRRPLPTGRRSTRTEINPGMPLTGENAGPAPLLLVQHPAHD